MFLGVEEADGDGWEYGCEEEPRPAMVELGLDATGQVRPGLCRAVLLCHLQLFIGYCETMRRLHDEITTRDI